MSSSFDVTKSIAVSGRRFSDGDFIEMFRLDRADNLFHDFDNENKIIQFIQHVKEY